MATICEEIREQARAERGPATAPLDQFDREVEPREAQVDEACRRIQRDCDAEVAEIEKTIAKRKQLAAQCISGLRASELELRERVGVEIVTEFYSGVAPHIAALDDSGRKTARAVADLIVFTGARARRELGVDFDAARHLAVAFCAAAIARNEFAVNTLADDAWSDTFGESVLSIAARAVSSFSDEDALLEALRRLQKFVEHYARNARHDLLSEHAVDRFELRRMGVDAAAHFRWAELFEKRHREREFERGVIKSQAVLERIQRARAGDVSAADGQPAGWFERVRNFVGDAFGPVLPVVSPTASRSSGSPGGRAANSGDGPIG
jgi:hypothetical protein